jgi:UDP-N-acetylglucosamine 2-epimerase (non-hydrolysing)
VWRWLHLSADLRLAICSLAKPVTDITCRSIQGLEALFKSIAPTWCSVQGDTTTAFAAARAAFIKDPVGHVEAGLATTILTPSMRPTAG